MPCLPSECLSQPTLYDLVIVADCCFIIKQNPGSFWYVHIICNLMGIIAAIAEPNFWISPMGILVSTGWVLSLIASIMGLRKGSANTGGDDHIRPVRLFRLYLIIN